MTSYVLCKTGSLAVFKVTARDQGHYKGHSGAFVTYCNISCSLLDSSILFGCSTCCQGMFNPVALRKAKLVYHFGLSGCNRVHKSWLRTNSKELIISHERVYNTAVHFPFH